MIAMGSFNDDGDGRLRIDVLRTYVYFERDGGRSDRLGLMLFVRQCSSSRNSNKLAWLLWACSDAASSKALTCGEKRKDTGCVVAMLRRLHYNDLLRQVLACNPHKIGMATLLANRSHLHPVVARVSIAACVLLSKRLHRY